MLSEIKPEINIAVEDKLENNSVNKTSVYLNGPSWQTSTQIRVPTIINMDRYNLRSGTVATAVTSSNLRVMDSEQTEEDRLAGYAVGHTARLSAEDVAPNLFEIGEISSPSETPETETSHSRTTQEPVTLFGVRGEVTIIDSPIPTLTRSLPILSPATEAAVVRGVISDFHPGAGMEPQHEFSTPPVLHPFYSSPPTAAACAILAKIASAPTPNQCISTCS